MRSSLKRRNFIGGLIVSLMGALALLFRRTARAAPGFRLRPPGALPESDFLAACTRCFKCSNACPNACIKFSGLEGGLENAFTPYIQARDRACILCGECAKACPTGALNSFEAERDAHRTEQKRQDLEARVETLYAHDAYSFVAQSHKIGAARAARDALVATAEAEGWSARKFGLAWDCLVSNLGLQPDGRRLCKSMGNMPACISITPSLCYMLLSFNMKKRSFRAKLSQKP